MPEGLYEEITQTIGNTPMVRLSNWYRGKQNIFAKLEYFNPGGSVKDRIGFYMLREAEKEGKLKPGCTIIEPTAGNTGIAIAIAAARRGYKMIFVVPGRFSGEKKALMKAVGAYLRQNRFLPSRRVDRIRRNKKDVHEPV